jgi:hypothetical protein
MLEKETLVIDGQEVILEPKNLYFSEQTLSEYLMKEGSWYDNFGAYLARAERELQIAESYYDNLYSLKFADIKEEGGSDKVVEARAKIDQDVITAAKLKTTAKYVVSRLKNHLKAWDKNHENARSLGYTRCKEMEKLGNDIRSRSYDAYSDIDSIVQHLDPTGEADD